MASFNQFTNLDFADLRQQIKDYLRANSEFTDFDFEGSNFSTLIDILAYNSYITSYNTNMVANEAFIDSATLRENVVSLARNIGYVPRSKRAAKAEISFTVDLTGALDARTLTIKAGQVCLGAVTNGTFIFSIPEDVTAPVNVDGFVNFDNLVVFEGVYLKSTFTMDYSQPNQRFILPNVNIDTTTIRVNVRDQVSEEYFAYQNILNVDDNTRIFLVQEVSDEKHEIVFGDGVAGKRPPNGSTIEVSYIVTNGRVGNGARNFTFSGEMIDNNLNSITGGISLILTGTPSENGDDIEQLDSVKYLAPRVYASQYRAVTANDYKGLVPYLFPNVESVSAYGGEELDPPEYGKVLLAIKPKNGKFLSQVTKLNILRSLKQYSIAGIRPEIIDLSYLYVEVDTSVYYNVNKSNKPQDVRTKVLNSLNVYSNSADVNQFGGRFKYSKVTTLIDEADKAITSNITRVLMRRDLQPEFNNLATYELCFGNKIHSKKNGFSIKSSGFRVSGVSETLYMADAPQEDEDGVVSSTSGTIYFFKLESNVPVIVTPRAGTVDYVKGEIILDAVNIISSDVTDGIQVQAIPDSNDVIALKDLYLQIDVSSSVVNMIEDVVTSGENTSATQYVSTSSYLNGKYTR